MANKKIITKNKNNPDWNLRVPVKVVNGNSEPIEGVEVTLRDMAGSSEGSAKTDSDGMIIFVENVGPSPCNTIQLSLPKTQVTETIGCFNGGQKAPLTTFTIKGITPSNNDSMDSGKGGFTGPIAIGVIGAGILGLTLLGD